MAGRFPVCLGSLRRCIAACPPTYIASIQCCHVVYAYLHAYETSYAIHHEKEKDGACIRMISLVDDTTLWRGNGDVLDPAGPVEVRRAPGRDLMVTRSPCQRTEIHGDVVTSVHTWDCA